jgi:aryl-alcohol dehydrogenase-like predicted oxidoreductase
MSLPQRALGRNGPLVSAIGFGAMGMSAFYANSQSDEESLKTLTRAADLGSTFWDTSDVYGPHTNEKLLGRWFKETGRRNEIFLCTKFGIDFSTGTPVIRGDREYIRSCVQGSLERLGVDHIDLYYQHRLDFGVCIEETVEALAELVKEGKVKHIGLSEVSANTLRRAHKVHPIAALQIEYSPFSLDIETNGVLETARELGIAIVAYSPLGRGFLTGQIKSPDDFEEGDFRKHLPRFSKENFPKNLKLVEELQKFGAKKNAQASQITLAWVLAQDPLIIPIPGTRRIQNLEENLAAAKIQFSEEELKELRAIIDNAEIQGNRYNDSFASLNFAESIPDTRKK